MPRHPEPEAMDDPAEAEAYARADFAEVNQAFVERLIELAGPDEAPAAVDLGTGPGDIPIRLARARPGWRITAVDVSAPMLALARRAAERAGMTGAVQWVLADAAHTRLPAGAFDVIFSNSILHHVAEPPALWAEVRRLARPGAGVLLRDLARPPTPRGARAIVARCAGGESDLLKQEFYRSLLAAYTVREVRGQLDRAGLGGLEVALVSDRHLDVFGRLG